MVLTHPTEPCSPIDFFSIYKLTINEMIPVDGT